MMMWVKMKVLLKNEKGKNDTKRYVIDVGTPPPLSMKKIEMISGELMDEGYDTDGEIGLFIKLHGT